MIANFEKFQEGVLKMDAMADAKLKLVDKAGDMWFNYRIKILTKNSAASYFLSEYSFADAVQNTIGDIEDSNDIEEIDEMMNWLVDEIHRQVKRIHEIVESDFKKYRMA